VKVKTMKKKYVVGQPHTKLSCAFEAMCTNCGFQVCILSKAWNYQIELMKTKTCPTCQHPISIERVYIRQYRKPIPKHIRSEIMKQYDNKCAFCKSTENLQIDHIIAVTAGGTNDENNLRVLCRQCNSGRDAELLTRIIKGEYVFLTCGREGILHLVKIKEEEVFKDSPLMLYGVRGIRAYSVLLCDNCNYLGTALQKANIDTNVLRYNEQYVLVGQKNIKIATVYINEAQYRIQETNE
jgi:hypothetical protein